MVFITVANVSTVTYTSTIIEHLLMTGAAKGRLKIFFPFLTRWRN